MQTIRILVFSVCFFSVACAQKPDSVFSIIPQPQFIDMRPGVFQLTAQTQLYFPGADSSWQFVADWFTGRLADINRISIQAKPISLSAGQAVINSIYLISDPKQSNREAYTIDVGQKYITIKAGSAAGAFYGLQTLWQMIPLQTSDPSPGHRIPACHIEDSPRFGYRGMHLDVSRHFFPVSFIKKYIDLLAEHKMNRFHWHLTDDQGWRIEIKKYPALQEKSACRKETLIGHYSDQPWKFDGKPVCAYYTQDEIKEVVAYAQKRFITIVPEIDMPGHSLAALSAYPDLGCTGGPYETATYWGVFDDVICVGNPLNMIFIRDVLAEVCALFPGEYIHIGGDECPKSRWKECRKCQLFKQVQLIPDEHAMQSWFTNELAKIVGKYDKRIIGWDEILEGGLAPGATVMSWRGVEGGIEAAKQGHPVIMTPTNTCYFDYYQADPNTEPLAIGGYLPIDMVYNFEPVPAALSRQEAAYILGAQGNVWTEYMADEKQVMYMVNPRLSALAEVVWTEKSKKNFEDFSRRLKHHFKRLDALSIPYSEAFFAVRAGFQDGKISLQTPDPELAIYYTLNGKTPDPSSLRYRGPFALKKSAELKAAAYNTRSGAKVGPTLTVQYLLHLASGKSYTMSNQPDKYKGAETFALTNGVVGGLRSWNNWVGLVNRPIDPAIDLGQISSVKRVTTQFLNKQSSWIYPPKSIEVFTSEDGIQYTSVGIQMIEAAKVPENAVIPVKIELGKTRKTRFVKLVAEPFGVIPEGMPGAGNGSWLFLDEVMVQ